MTKAKALCLDRQLCMNPECIGLESENLLSQSWLEVFDSGAEARARLRETPDINEAWVVSCGDVEPVNLAAALKKDRPELMVRLVVGQRSGSLCSRATAAQIDDVLELAAFARLYAVTKAQETRAMVTVPPALDAVALVNAAPVSDASAGITHANATNATQVSPAQTTTAPANAAQTSPPFMVKEPKPRPHKGFLMSVVSGSGGAGKSSVSVLAALYAAEHGCRTLLLDFDLQFGDIAAMVGSADTLGIDTLIADPERGRWVFSQQSGLAVLTAPTRLEAAEQFVDKLPRLLDEAMRHFDVIVANTGANWAEQHALLLERSSVALFLLDQRSSSIRACHHALELCARCGIASVPFKFALNRCSKNAPFDSADVSGVMQGAPIFELKDGGVEVEEYLASGHAAELRTQGNEFPRSVDRMMSRLLPKSDVALTQQCPTSERMQISGHRRSRFGKKRAKVAS